MARAPRFALPKSDSTVPVTPSIAAGSSNLRKLAAAEFARRLYEKMLKKNWNQNQLAVKSELGRDSVSRYMRGMTLPDPKSAKMLADALECEVSEIMPHAIERAYDNELPSLELRQVAGHGGVVWLRVNRQVTFKTAAAIVDLLNQEET
jgi:transcriptional regulator with XRE-family HTH domain